ncbi:MAG: CHAP domain-containing protein [Eubacterium sp.]
MTMDKWVKDYLGESIDYDGVYGVQCVDLIKHFVKNVLDITPQSIGNAIDYYNKRKTSSYLTDNFKWIDNTDSFIPAKGDLCVFTSKSGLGHISVASGEGTTSYFYSYDENYPSGKHEPMTKIKHTYSSFLGVLRPKNQENIVSSKAPSVKVGDKVTFSDTRKCYKGYGSKTGAYKIKELTAFTDSSVAARKAGTTHEVTAVKTLSTGNIWIEYKINSHKVYSCIYDKNINKSHIK